MDSLTQQEAGSWTRRMINTYTDNLRKQIDNWRHLAYLQKKNEYSAELDLQVGRTQPSTGSTSVRHAQLLPITFISQRQINLG